MPAATSTTRLRSAREYESSPICRRLSTSDISRLSTLRTSIDCIASRSRCFNSTCNSAARSIGVPALMAPHRSYEVGVFASSRWAQYAFQFPPLLKVALDPSHSTTPSARAEKSVLWQRICKVVLVHTARSIDRESPAQPSQRAGAGIRHHRHQQLRNFPRHHSMMHENKAAALSVQSPRHPLNGNVGARPIWSSRSQKLPLARPFQRPMKHLIDRHPCDGGLRGHAA